MAKVTTILGLESSCDDTAAAVVRQAEGAQPEVLSSVVFGQTDLHSAFGGVVPEIAARAHAEKLDICVRDALAEAGLALKDMDAVAVTAGPGLIGGVMSGVMCAKGIAAATGLPLILDSGIEGGLDILRAMALGADAIAVSNSAMQAVGCIAARMCNSNNCPVGIATQKPELRKRLDVQTGAERLARYFGASVELMQVLARACGHSSLDQFCQDDITTWKREMADLSGIRFAGVGG